ncbi:MAG TPA: hypothetical protein VM431_04505 [Phycisphaerae bacterium]|nr:hypothetical protein [Phycisphaerae bacterium]
MPRDVEDEPLPPASPVGADARGPDEPPDESRPDVSLRIASLVAAAVMTGIGIWLLQVAFGYKGPVPVAIALFVVACLPFIAAVVAVTMAIVGVPLRIRRSDKDIEEEAARLGLPTEPAAYQDGGVGVAATARTVTEAEMIAGRLNASGVPAWVDQPRASTTLWYAPLRREGVLVMIPLGRLADARAVLAERAPPDEPLDDEAQDASDDESRESAAPPGRPLAKRVASAFLLGAGIVWFAASLGIIREAAGSDQAIPPMVAAAAIGLLGLGLAVAGALGLRRRA